jgi:translation initiation factor IF-2
MPIKITDLAKELNLSNSEMVSKVEALGLGRLGPSQSLDDSAADTVRKAVAEAAAASPTAPVEVPVNVTVKELGERLGVGGGEIQKVLMGFGVLAGINQRLAPDAVERIAKKLGRAVAVQRPEAAPAPAAEAPAPKPAAPVAKPTSPKPAVSRVVAKGRASADMVARPPVITIMGHVDHGKTTLLDTLRKASVASGEAGGITQHIGAYQVEHQGKRLTFIDTPGHAAFSSMRARGAKVTDIVVIVVAADDSVMPQTAEAIKTALEAGVPMVVAVNKCDLPDSNPDRVLTDLTRYEIVPEAYGGDVQTVNISAKTGEGLDTLLETLLLVSEAVVDPKADPNGSVRGTILEARLDKGRGAVATVLVQQGTLRPGDVVVAGTAFGKVRGMADENGAKIAKAGPSTPVEIIGLGDVPGAGDRLEVVKDEREARAVAARREVRDREERLGGGGKLTLEQLYTRLRTGPIKELKVVLKADVQGSVQAIRDSIEPLGNDEVRVRVLHAAVGPIAESDIMLASADRESSEKNAFVIGFNVGTAGPVERKAEKEHVTIRNFRVIYELIDAVKEGMLALLPPIYEEHHLGKGEIRQLFKLPGGRQIAGSYITAGSVKRGCNVRVFRGNELLHTGEIDTLRRFKDDAREVQDGYECGMTITGFNELQLGDRFEFHEMRQIAREL